MKKNALILMAALIVLVMSLTAYSSAAVKLDEQHNGQSVEVNSGERITITLAGNPTTSYNWELSEFDAAMVELVGEPAYDSDSKLLGGGGAYTFTLKALTPGTTTLKLIYHRSWETDVEPLQVYEVMLNVK